MSREEGNDSFTLGGDSCSSRREVCERNENAEESVDIIPGTDNDSVSSCESDSLLRKRKSVRKESNVEEREEGTSKCDDGPSKKNKKDVVDVIKPYDFAGVEEEGHILEPSVINNSEDSNLSPKCFSGYTVCVRVKFTMEPEKHELTMCVHQFFWAIESKVKGFPNIVPLDEKNLECILYLEVERVNTKYKDDMRKDVDLLRAQIQGLLNVPLGDGVTMVDFSMFPITKYPPGQVGVTNLLHFPDCVYGLSGQSCDGMRHALMFKYSIPKDSPDFKVIVAPEISVDLMKSHSFCMKYVMEEKGVKKMLEHAKSITGRDMAGSKSWTLTTHFEY